MLNILDVSKWQGTINWDKVKASKKVDGVMLRVLGNKGGTPYVDPTFEANYKACIERGIPVGCYLYSVARGQAEANVELGMLRNTILGKTFQLPVALDIEDDKLRKLTKEKLTDVVSYELSMIQSWGVYTMLYTYLDFAKNYLYMTGAALKPYDVWLAAYRSTKPKTEYTYGMWQYTSKATIPGINGMADMSRAYKDYPAIIKRANLEQVK